VDKLSNINAGQTVTVQEGKGVIASRVYGNAPASRVRALKAAGK
jgi:hypothetical protein